MKSMHLRHFRILFVLIAMFVLSDGWAGRAEAEDSAGSGSGASGGSDRPNVVMIISDDQAWTDYGFMGHEHIQTPRLDELAAQSLTFTRGYVPTSLCRPSLATMISGLYPHQHGIVGNDPPWAGMDQGQRRPSHTAQPYLQSRIDYLRHIDAMTTLPDRLAPLGYRSLQTGKWWEGNFRRGGFDAGMTIGDMSRDGRHGDKGLKIGRQGIAEIDEFLDQCVNDQAPFFVWYAPFLPHTPHTPPQRLLDKYEPVAPSLPIAKYWAMCEWFDESCGAVLDSLQQRGLSDNTIVLYVCDNGWINRSDASRYAPRSKRSPNEGGIRTPIMVRWPGHVEPKMESDRMASSIDLVPTVLAAAGQDIPAELPGINLLDAAAISGRNHLFGEIFDHDIRSQTDPAASLQYRWTIRDSMKLIDPSESMDDQSLQLYDLADDPHENHDLAAERPDVVESLSKSLDQWWAPKTK
ncbi:Arylsulfatase precursor [Crateriforma conspicua]|uniref:Arylsulfatase n=1 Tax=Crateriforma conspicua TaxID=2527996 RepID=A0A5C6FX63_9PLAN|nr:sulfatase [Crateriforma conspicua]TWU66924.1 Arylsulfatase precursor [Crateriforma conspicua]